MHNPLTPLCFLERAASVRPDRTAITDGPRSFTALLQPALQDLSAVTTVREIVSLPGETGEAIELAGTTAYADLLAAGEDDPISVSYTSGTTSDPKGVVYTHRGAYLNALGEVIHQRFGDGSRYLWTLPMFLADGWCTTWALTAVRPGPPCRR